MSRRFASLHRKKFRSPLSVEQLESRITPTAFLLDDFQVEYLDSDNDVINITASQPIFTSLAAANSILTFVDGGGAPLTQPGNPSAVFETTFPLTGTPGILSSIDLT